TATLASVAIEYAYVPMPRILILLFAGWLVFVIVRDGAIFTRSSKSRILARSMLAAVTTNMELGIDWMFSARFVPVTMTSSGAPGVAGAAGAAAATLAGATGAASDAAASVATVEVLTCSAAAD